MEKYKKSSEEAGRYFLWFVFILALGTSSVVGAWIAHRYADAVLFAILTLGFCAYNVYKWSYHAQLAKLYSEYQLSEAKNELEKLQRQQAS